MYTNCQCEFWQQQYFSFKSYSFLFFFKQVILGGKIVPFAKFETQKKILIEHLSYSL